MEVSVAAADRAPRLEYHTSRFDSGAEVDAHLSWLQTRLSTERTLMSLVRFAVTLIALGVTIVEYLAHLARTAGVRPGMNPDMVYFVGVGMIGAGVVLMLIALYQYRALMAFLWSADHRPIAGTAEDRIQTVGTVALAVVLALAGIATFGAVLLRLA
jgi:uncharacterized membrane protein YidH (DUF202 family)